MTIDNDIMARLYTITKCDWQFRKQMTISFYCIIAENESGYNLYYYPVNNRCDDKLADRFQIEFPKELLGLFTWQQFEKQYKKMIKLSNFK